MEITRWVWDLWTSSAQSERYLIHGKHSISISYYYIWSNKLYLLIELRMGICTVLLTFVSARPSSLWRNSCWIILPKLHDRPKYTFKMKHKNCEKLREKFSSIVFMSCHYCVSFAFIQHSTQSHSDEETLPVRASLDLGQMRELCGQVSKKVTPQYVPGSKFFSSDLPFLANEKETKKYRLGRKHKETINFSI